ncbi:MAG: OsmC family protein [Acidobacteriota bacterium]
MTGTFGGALEARTIPADGGRLTATAVGDVELEGKVLVIKRIHVEYHLQVDAGTDLEVVQRVMEKHPAFCPVYRSLHPQIRITLSLSTLPV